MSDLIDRRVVIHAMLAYMAPIELGNGVAKVRMLDSDAVIKIVTAIPSAQPERKKGEWIPVTNGRGGFECDQCHNYAPSYQDGVEWLSGFCPNCGADMREVDDERPD
jgi:hypothetical protein